MGWLLVVSACGASPAENVGEPLTEISDTSDETAAEPETTVTSPDGDTGSSVSAPESESTTTVTVESSTTIPTTTTSVPPTTTSPTTTTTAATTTSTTTTTPPSTMLVPSGPPQVSIAIRFDADGNDNENKNDEWVRFTNESVAPLDMTGWTVNDEGPHRYRFGDLVLPSGGSVTLFTGCGTDTATERFWCNSGSAVWNNSGDTVFLSDGNGTPVAQRSG